MTPTHVIKNKSGFTLVELMIAVFLSAIAAIAIYRGYTSFSQTADAQEQMIEMQQNLRIGMFHLEKHLRRAGMNEEDDENAGFTLDPGGNGASESSLSFTMDMGGTDRTTADETWNSGDPGDGGLDDDDEWLTFQLMAVPLPAPVPPAPWTNFFNLVLTDENNGDPNLAVNTVIITNVDALNFVYLNEDNNETGLDPDETPDDVTTGRKILNPGEMNLIRSVQVALVVRTTNEDYRYTNNEEYRNAQGSLIYTAPGDNFRRRLFIKEIKIRNAGL